MLIAGALRLAAPAAWRGLAVGAAMAGTLGVLARLLVISLEPPAHRDALVWVAGPGFAATFSGQSDPLAVVWAVALVGGVVAPLLTLHDGNARPATSTAIALAGAAGVVVTLAGDLVAIATALSIATLAAFAGGHSARRPTDGAAEPGAPPVRPPWALDQAAAPGLLLLAYAIGNATAGSFRVLPVPLDSPLPLLPLLAAAVGELILARVYPFASVPTAAGAADAPGAAAPIWAALLTFLGVFALARVASLAIAPAHQPVLDVILIGGLLTALAGALRARAAADARGWAVRTLPCDVGLALVAVALAPRAPDATLNASLALMVASRVFGVAALALASTAPAGNGTGHAVVRQLARAIAFGTLVGLPPLPSFWARALLVHALVEQGAWFAGGTVTLATALVVAGGVVAALRGADWVGGDAPEDDAGAPNGALAVAGALAGALVTLGALAGAMIGWLFDSPVVIGAPWLELPALLLAATGVLAGYLLAAAGLAGGVTVPARPVTTERILDAPARALAGLHAALVALAESLSWSLQAVERERYLPAAIVGGVLLGLLFTQ